MTDHGGTADDLSRINLADENGCAHAMNLQAPHVMSGGGVREDTTTAMRGEGGQQDDGVAGVEQHMQVRVEKRYPIQTVGIRSSYSSTVLCTDYLANDCSKLICVLQ